MPCWLKKFTFIQFIMLVLAWHRTGRWLKKSTLPPLKRDMIVFMRDMTYVSLRVIGWWVPKHTVQSVTPELPALRQAAFLERAKHDKR